jgi:hypothetical protein
MAKFPEIYESRLRARAGTLRPSFDPNAALAGYDDALTELGTDGMT